MSSGRYNTSLLVGDLFGLKASSKVSPRETSGSSIHGEWGWRGLQERFVQATNVHITNKSAVTAPIFTKL